MYSERSEGEHDVLWLEVPVNEPELIQLLNAQYDLVEDFVKKFEAPLLIQPLSEAHLIWLDFDCKVVDAQEDAFVLAQVRDLLLCSYLENGEVCLGCKLDGVVHYHVLIAVNPEDSRFLKEELLLLVRVYLQGTLLSSLDGKEFHEWDVVLDAKHLISHFLIKLKEGLPSLPLDIGHEGTLLGISLHYPP